MFLLARKGFADRIKLRSVFGGDSVLLKHGLLRHPQSPLITKQASLGKVRTTLGIMFLPVGASCRSPLHIDEDRVL